MKYVSPHYEYTLDLLAGQLVTPERFGAIALAEVVDAPLFELPTTAA